LGHVIVKVHPLGPHPKLFFIFLRQSWNRSRRPYKGMGVFVPFGQIDNHYLNRKSIKEEINHINVRSKGAVPILFP
jgi:hypothetical protein